MGLVKDILEDLRKKVDDLEDHEQSRQRKTQSLEEALVRQSAHLVEAKNEVRTLSKEAVRLREYVHQLVSHIKIIEAGLATLDSDKVARRLHEQNNSWMIPDGLERRIYEEAVEKMGALIKDIVTLPTLPEVA